MRRHARQDRTECRKTNSANSHTKTRSNAVESRDINSSHHHCLAHDAFQFFRMNPSVRLRAVTEACPVLLDTTRQSQAGPSRRFLCSRDAFHKNAKWPQFAVHRSVQVPCSVLLLLPSWLPPQAPVQYGLLLYHADSIFDRSYDKDRDRF